MEKVKTIDSYIDSSPKNVRSILQTIRKTIKKAAPKAEERISYGMPSFNLNGYLVYFAAWKNHIGFYPASPSTVAIFKRDLAKYDVSKGTIRFPIDKPLPLALITKIVKYRVKENLKKK